MHRYIAMPIASQWGGPNGRRPQCPAVTRMLVGDALGNLMGIESVSPRLSASVSLCIVVQRAHTYAYISMIIHTYIWVYTNTPILPYTCIYMYVLV